VRLSRDPARATTRALVLMFNYPGSDRHCFVPTRRCGVQSRADHRDRREQQRFNGPDSAIAFPNAAVPAASRPTTAVKAPSRTVKDTDGSGGQNEAAPLFETGRTREPANTPTVGGGVAP
jgi:hypothetical protein